MWRLETGILLLKFSKSRKQIMVSSILPKKRTKKSTLGIIVLLQVNLCQKLSYLNQLTHNMTRDCSLNPQKNTSSEHVVYKYCFECQNKNNNYCCAQHVLNLYFSGNSMNNLLSYCGLTERKMRASEKDLPVQMISNTC